MHRDEGAPPRALLRMSVPVPLKNWTSKRRRRMRGCIPLALIGGASPLGLLIGSYLDSDAARRPPTPEIAVPFQEVNPFLDLPQIAPTTAPQEPNLWDKWSRRRAAGDTTSTASASEEWQSCEGWSAWHTGWSSSGWDDDRQGRDRWGSGWAGRSSSRHDRRRRDGGGTGK